MTTYVQITPQELLASTFTIDWVERKLNAVEYNSGNVKHSVDYGSVQAAQDAVDAFYLESNPNQPNGKPKNYKFAVATAVLEGLVSNVSGTGSDTLDEFMDKMVEQAWVLANKMDVAADAE